MVGAYGYDSLEGRAFVLDIDTGNEVAELKTGTGTSEWFGWDVAISGDKAIIGAIRDSDNGNHAGAVFVFDANTGTEIAKLLAPDGAADDEFGFSVAIDGDLVVVGARSDDDNGAQSGSIYIYDLNLQQWVRKITPADGAAGDLFGYTVAIEGDLVLVGAYLDDDDGSASGSAYLFSASTGQELYKFRASDAVAGQYFGSRVDLNGGYAVIGCSGDDDNGPNAGGAYIFSTITGLEHEKYLASDGEDGDELGYGVAISGKSVMVSSMLDSGAEDYIGGAYYYDLNPPCGVTYCGVAQNPNNFANIAVSTCDSAAASILVSLTLGTPNQFTYLLVGDGMATVSQPPGAVGDLCVVGGACLGRYDLDVGAINAAGEFSTDIMNAISNPCAGGVTITSGSTWNFQYWMRQPAGQPATFSEAISVTFD